MVAELSKGGASASAPKDLGKLSAELPDAASWPAIRAAVAAADRRAKDLAMENERLKEQIESGGGGGASGGGASMPRASKKAAFAPSSAGATASSAAAKLKARAAARTGGGEA